MARKAKTDKQFFTSLAGPGISTRTAVERCSGQATGASRSCACLPGLLRAPGPCPVPGARRRDFLTRKCNKTRTQSATAANPTAHGTPACPQP